MLGFDVWTVTLIVLPGLVLFGAWLAESAWTGGVLATARSRILVGAGCVLVLLVLAVAYQSHALASPDGRAVAHVSAAPGSTLANLMTYATLLGDTVPSMLLATVLAVLIFRRGVAPYLCAILPILVLVELYVQLGMWKIFDDETIGTLRPSVPIGGVGQIPSGSVARLMSVTLVAAMLLFAVDVLWARRVVTLGVILTTVQITSRLVLGRHLYADLVAGIALGLMLTLVASFVILPVRQRGAARVRSSPGVAAD